MGKGWSGAQEVMASWDAAGVSPEEPRSRRVGWALSGTVACLVHEDVVVMARGGGNVGDECCLMVDRLGGLEGGWRRWLI